MRILFCTNSIGARGGIERVTIVKANALAEIEGNEVAICYTDRGTFPQQTIHPLSDKVMTFDLGVSFWDLFPLNLKTLLVTAPSKFIALRRSLRRLIDTYRPDVVISTGSYEKFGLASLRLKKPTVKIREYHFNSNYRKLSQSPALIRLAGYFDNHFISRCFDMNYLLTREDLSNYKGKRRFDCQANPCSFADADDGQSVARENVVLAVGRLVDVKNFASLIRIWAAAEAQVKDWQLWIAGEGDQRAALQRQIDELALGDSVKLLGFRSDVRQLMLRSRVLAMTSKYEGFGLILLEAMHCGVVPITFATPYGPRDIVNDGVDGVLVDYLDEKQFAERLVSLLHDPQGMERMSAAAVERAKDFTPEKICNEWMAKYRGLIEQKSGK